MKTVPTHYQTSDGREFDSKAEAVRHEALSEARENYERAWKALGRCFAETQKTADGVLFDPHSWHDYWYVFPGYAGYQGMPSLVKVSFCLPHFDYDERDDSVVVRQRGNGERDHRYRIGELYWNKEPAERALLAAQEAYLAECAAEVAKLRERLA